MIYLQLFWEFFKIGLFAVGGGMATLPFLQKLAVTSGWYSQALITDMIAVSESTPGPIGVNMATYVGCSVAGVGGGIVATLGVITPAIIIVNIVSTYLEKFRESSIVESMFYGLRPAVTGLIAAAGFSVVEAAMLHTDIFAETHNIMDLIELKKLIWFVLMFAVIRKYKPHPILCIAVSAAAGIILLF
ncbi:MAG: chromate transporter [Solobacterium sp.]|nr:chromate transporter [Solobacterium sp.]